MIAWILANWGLIATVLFGISESLALIPQVKANGVFQAVMNVLKALVAAKPAP